jgi:hypothetical protein
MKRALWPIFLFSLAAAIGSSQMDELLIYGNGWMFNVKEPTGWTGHTEDAYRYRVNAYFCLGKKSFNKSSVVMHITINSKRGDTLQQIINSDIADYKKRHQKLELQEFPISELGYEVLSKKYSYDEKTIDYVCILDPNKDSPFYLVFVLNGPKEESPKYEKDFLSLIRSFSWLGGNVKK